TLTAQSEGCGKGAAFILELPLDTPSQTVTMRHPPSNGGSNNAALVSATVVPQVTLPPKRGGLEEVPQNSRLN
ncbi:MAG: hypothetical protein ABSA83_21825, partial [Verrucomicrobiota bacterium]